jgi:F-type H+-transporting ATPase subunit alpha
LDPLPLPAVTAFRQGLGDIIDRGAPDAVRMIQSSGTLDDAQKKALGDILRQYVHGFIPATAPKAATPS